MQTMTYPAKEKQFLKGYNDSKYFRFHFVAAVPKMWSRTTGVPQDSEKWSVRSQVKKITFNHFQCLAEWAPPTDHQKEQGMDHPHPALCSCGQSVFHPLWSSTGMCSLFPTERMNRPPTASTSTVSLSIWHGLPNLIVIFVCRVEWKGFLWSAIWIFAFGNHFFIVFI